MLIEQRIINWIAKYLTSNNLDSLVVGISGGIDSAVVSTLCAMTGFDTKLVIMPIHQNPCETERAINHCQFLQKQYKNTEIVKVELSDIYEQYNNKFFKKKFSKLSLANLKARIRMMTLYLISGNTNGLVVGTGNKIEDFGVGFFTKYGDGGVDISPIADLMKSEVYDLAKQLNINQDIIDAPPTDGLWEDGRTDVDQLGISYDDLEWAMNYKTGKINKVQKTILKIYNKHRKKNLHKMRPIPIFKK